MASLLTARGPIVWPDAVGPQGPLGGMGVTLLGVLWMQFFLASAFLALRLLARYLCGKWAGWALFWAGASWSVGLIAQIMLNVAIGKSLNGFSDTWTVPTALMILWTSIFLTFVAIGLSKFSVVAFLLAMQGMTHLRERYFLLFLAASNMIIDVAFVLFMAFHCNTPFDMWDDNASSSCLPNFMAARDFGFFTGSWNAASDLILALYPLLILRTVNIAPGVKRGLMFVMSLGIISFVCAVVKTWDLRFVTNTNRFDFSIFCLTIWTYTEMWVVLMTASIPPLWPLFKRARNKVQSRVSTARGWVTSNHSRSISGYNGSRSRSEKLLREKPSLLTSRSIAEGGFSVSTPEPDGRVTPLWNSRLQRMRSPSHGMDEPVGEQPEDIEIDDLSPRIPDLSHIMVTTELSIQHEAITPNNELEDEPEMHDPDMRAAWVRRALARDPEIGKL